MASEYGLSATGFRRKRLPDIIKSLNDRVADALGVQIRTEAGSVFGQIHGVYAYEIADLWEQAENIYHAMYPSTAQGTSLSNAAGLAGIQLVEAEYTTIIATCYGVNGTEIPYAAQITDGTNTFSCLDVYAQIVTSRASTAGIKLTGTVVEGKDYTLTIDGDTQTYTAISSDTENSVLVNLAALFLFSDRTFSVNDGALVVAMADESRTMNIIPGDNTYVSYVGSPFNFQCDTAGAITPALGTVNQIVASYAGWDSVTNNVPAATGRDAESDISLRQRWSSSVYSRASAMVDAIRAALYKVDGVTYAIVYENDTDSVDDEGRPPHSIEAIVSGGADADIAKAIWISHAGGITTYGDVEKAVTDSQGVSHTMRFNRPTEVPIYLNISVTGNPEKDLSGAAVSLIQRAIVTQGSQLNVGQDVVLQAFYGTVMQATSYAVGYMEITASTDGENFSTSNIEISPRELAVFSAENINVTIVTP